MSLMRMVKRREGKLQLAVLFFLVGFSMGLIVLSYYYLIPALQASLQARQAGDKEGARAIAATSALLLVVVMVILFSGIALTFRMGRYFFPRKGSSRVSTQYVDAWAAAGQRVQQSDVESMLPLDDDDAKDKPGR